MDVFPEGRSRFFLFHHPHIVSPVERYKGRTIAYSLGNWEFSYGRFFNGRLRFPESSFHQIAVELIDTDVVIHHVRFQPPTTVVYTRAETVTAEGFTLKPVFEGFSHPEYERWFKANRIKKKGLPIYRDASDSPSNSIRDSWVRVRQVLVDGAAKSRLKSMRRRI